MGVVTLYGIRNCDTVKRARAWLEERGVEYRFHDYKLSGVDAAQLERWSSEVGWAALLNRAGTTFRKLPERDKVNLNERKALSLMAVNPSVIKRPVLDLGERIVIGFKPALYESLRL
jgi:arsenate reductase